MSKLFDCRLIVLCVGREYGIYTLPECYFALHVVANGPADSVVRATPTLTPPLTSSRTDAVTVTRS